MFGRSRVDGPKDPSVAGIDEILGLASPAGPNAARPPAPRPIATDALWICACLTFDDAPTWLIYDTEAGVAWCRVTDRVDPLELVDARLSAGGHADPKEVLLWLEGKAPDPWGNGGNGSGEAAAVEHLGRRIRRP